MSLKNFRMNLTAKLVSVIAVALLSMMAIGAIAIQGLRDNASDAQHIVTDGLRQLGVAGDLRAGFARLDALVAKAPLELDLPKLEDERSQFRSITGKLTADLKVFQNDGHAGEMQDVEQSATAPEPATGSGHQHGGEAPADDHSTATSGHARHVAEMLVALDHFVAEGEKVYDHALQFDQQQAFDVLNGGAKEARAHLEGSIQEFIKDANKDAQSFADRIAQNRDTLTWTMVGTALALVILVVLMAIFVVGGATRALRAMTGVTGRLAAGDMEVHIPGGERHDEIGEMARSLDQIRAVGIRAARAQSSLDDASSPMMIVDPDGKVIFPNKAMNALAEDLAADLGGELSGFKENSLAGVLFDTLHNLDSMRADRMVSLTVPASARMAAGGRIVDLMASPVFNDQGDRLGVVIEWQDRTSQVTVENEIAGIVHAASEGDFSQRLREADKNGFMADLANGMNELLDVVDHGLGQVVRVVSALAEGDLTKRMQGTHKGAFLRLKEDADRMGEQMEDMLGRIAGVTHVVKAATDEISSGVMDLSVRTEHQASSIEETTASMEELAATVRQNADNAQEANQVAAGTREAAVSGGDVANRAVKAIEIVGLIQEIAFQTNLLALNASVEAARAGESGRGFAVVANEVRALAQRAASASKDIKELITNSGTQVQEGVKLVGEAGASLEEIVASVKKVADYVSEIAAASQEQTSGIDQVSGAITSMDEMTQQNASLVEEATGAIQSAVGQVEDLQAAVGFFKTSRSDRNDTDAKPASGAPLRDMALKMSKPSTAPVRPQDGASGRRAASAAAEMADSDWEEF